MKRLVASYTFNASAKTITFPGFTTLELERILIITNVTRNTIIYNFASTGGTVSGNILTLSSSLNTTGMANTDKLQIFYDYPESIGSAGTANTDVSTVQGITGGVPLSVSMNTAPAGLAYLSTATITRAANTTPYTANDVYGTVFELQNIGPSGGFVFLSSLDIMFNLTTLPSGMSSFAIYLYSSSPPSAITDNNPFNVASGDRASIMSLNGFNLFASLARGGGSVVAESLGINQLFKLASNSTSIWGYLVTVSAFTPAANSETAIIKARSFAA